MKIIKIRENTISSAVKKAAAALMSGELVVYPTDTAYGLGVNALDDKAVSKIYELKERDYSKPTHVVVRDWEMIEELTQTNRMTRMLYDRFLPGPLTIILPKSSKIPDVLTAGLPTVGIRVPDNLITQSLSKLLPFPYTTPSANRSGERTPYSVDDLKNVLNINKVDIILDAGKLPPTPPSTLVDLSGGKVKIIREGPISRNEIEKAIGLTLD